MKHYQISNQITDASYYLYVERPEDQKLLRDCNTLPYDQVISIVGPRQIGKSSLVQQLIRTQTEHKVVNLDFRHVFSSTELVMFRSQLPAWEVQPKFADAFLEETAIALDQYEDFSTWQTKHEKLAKSSPLGYLQRGFERLVNNEKQIILIVCDEWDKLASLGVYAEFIYLALETWLQELKVRWILVSNTAPLDMLKEQPRSKFGFFKKYPLNDFDPKDERTITEWSAPLLDTQNPEQAFTYTQEALKLTGGQPILTAALLSKLQLWNKNKKLPSLEAFNKSAFALTQQRHNTDFSGHFDYAGETLTLTPSQGFEALTLYKKLFSQTEPTRAEGDEAIYSQIELLRRAGMIKVLHHNDPEKPEFTFRSPLHKFVYNTKWIEQQTSQLLKSLPQKSVQTFLPDHPQKLLVINVGGTMGMEVMADGQVKAPQDESRFFNQFPGISSFARIVPMSYKPTDGANIGVDHWQHIAELIYRQLSNDDHKDDPYQGIVIIHGTDTLTYTASAVAFALGPNLSIPVVFTGAQSPNNVVHGDSPPNFLRACRVAAESQIKEVVVVFNDKILRAVRTEKRHDYLFDGFHSPSLIELGKIGESIQYLPLTKLSEQTNFTFDDASWQLRNQFSRNILHISQAPGVNPTIWKEMIETKPLDGVFLESLGVFNIPIEGEASYVPLIRAAVNKGIPVFVSSRYPIQPEFRANYAPAKKAEELGGLIAGNMTVPAALTKFMWALAQYERDKQTTTNNKHQYLKVLLESSYVGELDPSQPMLSMN